MLLRRPGRRCAGPDSQRGEEAGACHRARASRGASASLLQGAGRAPPLARRFSGPDSRPSNPHHPGRALPATRLPADRAGRPAHHRLPRGGRPGPGAAAVLRALFVFAVVPGERAVDQRRQPAGVTDPEAGLVSGPGGSRSRAAHPWPDPGCAAGHRRHATGVPRQLRRRLRGAQSLLALRPGDRVRHESADRSHPLLRTVGGSDARRMLRRPASRRRGHPLCGPGVLRRALPLGRLCRRSWPTVARTGCSSLSTISARVTCRRRPRSSTTISHERSR